jgi:altronate hydrolase
MNRDTETPNALRIDRLDNVVIVLEPIPVGGTVRWAKDRAVVARSAVPIGHKVASEAISAGEAIRKYGYAIGTAGEKISSGDWVHTHNVSAKEE